MPGVLVTTVEFADSAKQQSERLGIDTAQVLVEHPIQDRTDQEMRVIADNAIDSLLSSLSAQRAKRSTDGERGTRNSWL